MSGEKEEEKVMNETPRRVFTATITLQDNHVGGCSAKVSVSPDPTPEEMFKSHAILLCGEVMELFKTKFRKMDESSPTS